MVFQLAYGLETVVLRVFNVYGPRQGFGEYGGVIAQFVRRLLVGEPPVVYGDGMQTRDFVYVDDVVEAVLMSLINSDVGGGVFNIGSGKPTAINELLELILRITEREVDPIYSEQRLGDIRHSYADLGKARAP
jgi:UDP-glucose 4-epimerase